LNGAGCIDTATKKVVVKPLPVINPIAATPDNICDQANAVLAVLFPSYCVPTLQNAPSYPCISVFALSGGINNNTGTFSLGYTYYNMTANVTAGNNYTVVVTRNPGPIGPLANNRDVWIDYNQDGDFADAGENVFHTVLNNQTVSSTITIPTTAVNGTTRIRVGAKTSGTNTPCFNNGQGEFEDYNLNVSGGINNISWMPNTFLANNIGNNVNVSNINSTTTYTVTFTGENGCSNTDSVTIHVYPNTSSYTNATICVNQIPYSWNGLTIDSQGVYTVTIPNANGCDSVATLNLNISVCGLCQNGFTANWSPFIDSLVESQTWINTSGTVLIPVGAKVKFDANVGGYVTLNPGFKADSGSIFVAQAYNGCTAGAPQLPNAKIFTGETYLSAAADEIVLYPNPTSGLIHIQHEEKLSNIQIFDMVGKLVIQQKCNGETETNIDLSNLPNGVYHVKAAGYNSVKVVKNN
jgi:hypothetical protein